MRTAYRTAYLTARLTPMEMEQISVLAAKLGTTKTNAIVRAVELALIKLAADEEGVSDGETESTN